MRILCVVVLAGLVTFGASARNIKLDKIGAEVKALHFDEVQSFVEKLGASKKLTRKEKIEVLADLHDIAADVADEFYEKRSLRRSWKDAAKTIFGAGGVLVGLGIAFVGPKRFDKNRSALLGCRIGGGITSLLSCYLFYKGITCSTQQGWIKQARAIQSVFNEKYNEELSRGSSPQVISTQGYERKT